MIKQKALDTASIIHNNQSQFLTLFLSCDSPGSLSVVSMLGTAGRFGGKRWVTEEPAGVIKFGEIAEACAMVAGG